MRFNSIGQRVRYAVRQSGRSAQEVATKANMARSTLYDLMRDRQEGSKRLPGIARATGFNLDWLLYETGPETNRPGDNNVAEFTPKKKYPVISWVQAGQYAESGDPFEPGDAEDWEFAPRDAKPTDASFWLEVRGNSMVSSFGGVSFPPGTLILVDPEIKHCSTGEFVVAKQVESGKVTFKRLNRDDEAVYLEPLNTQYPVIQADCNTEIIGKVIAYTGSL